MFLKSQTFDHNANDINDSFGIPKKTVFKCKERIFFSVIANAMQCEEYENSEIESDPPKEISTKSGVLSHTLNLINSEDEYEYTLLNFFNLHDLAEHAVKQYLVLHSPKLDDEKKDHLRLIMKLQDSVVDHLFEKKSKSKDPYSVSVTPSLLMKRCDLVKKSNYNWNTYYNMVMSNVDKSTNDVDDMLNSLFSNDDSVD